MFIFLYFVSPLFLFPLLLFSSFQKGMKSSEMMKSSGRSLRLPLPPPPYVRMSNEEVGSLFKGSGSSCARSMGSLKSSSSPSSPSSFSSSPASSFSSPSKILPFLFVGNQADANDLKKLLQLNISFILSLTTDPTPSDASNHFEDYGIRFKRLPVADHCKENLMQHFEEAFNFIGEWIRFDTQCVVENQRMKEGEKVKRWETKVRRMR